MEHILSYQKTLTADVEQYFKDQAGARNANRWQADTLARLEEYTAGGKLLRGSLVRFAHEVFGGDQPQAAQQTAVALELIHSALLIHDDIIDRDSLRRGRPAMHVHYEKLAGDQEDAAHFGESMALCVADAAIFLAVERLGRLDIPLAQRERLMALFSDTLTMVCAGQMLDIELGGRSSRGVKKHDILTVMEQKTAAYSVSLPLAAGAILAGQPDAVIGQLTRAGTSIGIIFQIRDDELGVFGQSSETGKPIGSDIKEGKKTLLYYYLIKGCSAAERRRLLAIFGNQDIREKDVAYVRQAMRKAGVPEAINTEVETLSLQAAKDITELPIAAASQKDLLEFLDFCAKRNA